MKNFFIPSLGILMASSLSVAIAQQPAPEAQSAASIANALAIKQELRTTFAYKKPVRVGALMTKREKIEYRRAMQTAKTAEARQQIRELTYARLNQRATERGMFVVIPNRTARAEPAPLREPARATAATSRPAVAATHPVRQPPLR